MVVDIFKLFKIGIYIFHEGEREKTLLFPTFLHSHVFTTFPGSHLFDKPLITKT